MKILISVLLFISSHHLFAIQAEHHLLLCDNDPRAVMAAFKVTPNAKSRTDVIYLDTADMHYYKKGIVSRLRFYGDKFVKVDLKLRPIDPQKVPAKWLNHAEIKCEIDVSTQKRVGACRLRHKLNQKEALKALKSGQYSKLFSQDQNEFLHELTGEELDAEELKIYGPTRVESWDSSRFAFELELVMLRDGKHLAEISTRKSSAAGGFEKGLISLAREKGLKICRSQDSKTKRIIGSYLNAIYRRN